jgi:ATP-dependent DNA helicase RecQ
MTQLSKVHQMQALLKKHFGYDSFRPPQDQIVADLIEGQDLLVIMPTGGGKSLCYQLPALIRPGVAIVISPLIALMEDQVKSLKNQGIEAAFYNSTLNSEQAREVLNGLHRDQLKLLYIAPERLMSLHFIQRLQTCQIAFFAIDEAHCIAQWGPEFRPEYAQLGELKKIFPSIPLIALTATATPLTRDEIINNLHYQPKSYVASFNRPNIYIEVREKQKPFEQLLQFIKQRPTQSGIIYCRTRDKVEQLAVDLQQAGLRAEAYHAGLPYEIRRQNQALFQEDRCQIMVATIAFGMGIHKSNIRFVVHYDLPKNLESYYQEIGRAGRDGLRAQALLLYDPKQTASLRSWIFSETPTHLQAQENHKLNHLIAFSESPHCKRQLLLQYFGEESESYCGFCHSCDYPKQKKEATIQAQQFLSCIYRLNQNYGLQHVIQVLRGGETQKILKANHHFLSTYGIGKHYSAAFWKQLAWQLIHQGYCVQNAQRHNTLALTKKSVPLLKGEEGFVFYE